MIGQVPRKSYREYHADIYPDTSSTQPGMGPQNWLEGANVAPVKLSLNPAKRPETLTQFGPALADIPRSIAPPANQKTETSVPTNQRKANGVSTNQRPANGISTNGSSVHSGNGQMSPKPSPRHRVVRCNSEAGAGQLSSAPRPAPRPVSVSVSGNTQLSLVDSR